MLTMIIPTLSSIAVIISFICVIIMNIIVNIIVGCYMEQNKEYEAEVERLKAALENAASKEK